MLSSFIVISKEHPANPLSSPSVAIDVMRRAVFGVPATWDP